jgi:hypothetical protein
MSERTPAGAGRPPLAGVETWTAVYRELVAELHADGMLSEEHSAEDLVLTGDVDGLPKP